MQLQDQLINQLTESIRLGSKIRRDADLTTVGVYALDAVEKNKNVSGSLAAIIDRVNSDLQSYF